MSAPQRREAARYLQSHYEVSERRACATVKLSRSVHRYQARRPDQSALRRHIRQIAHTRVRYGYLRIWTLLRRQGVAVNKKRVHRLYCLEGLQLRPKRPRRHVSAARRQRPTRTVKGLNDAWSLDFVAGELAGRSKFRMLPIVDVCSRECLGIEVGQRLGAENVVAALERIRRTRGAPRRLFCDNGSEFQSRLVDLWAYQHQVTVEFSRPGKPTDNAHIESFNGRFRDECLNTHWFADLTEARTVIEAWRTDYNESRPHMALNSMTPLEYANELRLEGQKSTS